MGEFISETRPQAVNRISAPAILAVLLAVCLLVPTAVAQDEEPDAAIVAAQQATVFLMQTYSIGGAQALSCVGSGTLIGADGLILTNAHLALAEGPCHGERIVVALPTRLDEPPVPTYVAEIAQIDTRLDLAVLQITGGLDGSVIDPSDLNLPYVQVGDPLSLLPGNTLIFTGYADLGATNVSSTSGLINGITVEKSGSRLAWFRTDAVLGGGMSGGGAYDANGLLIGVPTSASPTDGSTPSETCLSIQDNSQDGLITEQDACVPIGAPVTQIRPVSFAIPLIEAAKNGFSLSRELGLPATPPIGQPTFSRLFFSAQVSELGIPTQIVRAAPTGTTSLFLFFDYQNMRPGIAYELEVTLNGLEVPQLSLGPLAWTGGTNGTWYIGTENVGWPDGTYEFTLKINDQPVAAQSITVGGAPAAPSFGNLTFGVPSASGGFASTGTLLPSLITQIDAQFDFQNMLAEQAWTEVWYLDDTEVSRVTRVWDAGPSGQSRVSAINYSGLPLGTYRLELLIGDQIAATGDIRVAGNQGANAQPVVFANARTSTDISREGAPAGQTGSALPFGVTDIYAFMDWDLLPTGVLWTYRWYLDGRLVGSSTETWDAGGVGQDFWVRLSSREPLPEGTYVVEVFVENQPMFSKDVSIGSGTQPISGLESPSNELFISGTVLDAISGEGIPGALVFVLDVTLESPMFTWDESEIHTQAVTDQNGRFSFPRGIPKGAYYTVYVMAEGYITVVEDNFTVLSTQPSPVEITIEMSKP